MTEQEPDKAGHNPKREQTDSSLRVERHKVDAQGDKQRRSSESEEDAILHLARENADEVLKTARDEATRTSHNRSAMSVHESIQANDQADIRVENERANADTKLTKHRAARKRYLAEFLATERGITDISIRDERLHADNLVALRDDFLATVTHDLRSLLAGMLLNAELLIKQSRDADKVLRHATTNRRLVARMNRLVNDLLDVASIEAGQLILVPETTHVNDILQDILDAFHQIAAAKDISLACKVDTLTCAWLDSGRILQVLTNLVSNAIKFTPAGGHVLVLVRILDDKLAFAVSDSGVGIAECDLTAVFDRFRQVGVDRRGLGLGLHISKSIVEAHGGQMWVKSAIGRGSTFHFTLPYLKTNPPINDAETDRGGPEEP